VKPPIFPTSKYSNLLVIPVFAELLHLTYGKSLRKFYDSYSFQFQDIPPTLIPEKVVFYHTSQWKIVFSYVCLGRTLLFEFILSTQFSINHIQVLCKISCSLSHHEISLENQSCLVVLCQDPSPLSIPPLFPALCYSLPAGIIGGFTVLSFPRALSGSFLLRTVHNPNPLLHKKNNNASSSICPLYKSSCLTAFI